jgi:hypothetical protein
MLHPRPTCGKNCLGACLRRGLFAGDPMLGNRPFLSLGISRGSDIPGGRQGPSVPPRQGVVVSWQPPAAGKPVVRCARFSKDRTDPLPHHPPSRPSRPTDIYILHDRLSRWRLLPLLSPTKLLLWLLGFLSFSSTACQSFLLYEFRELFHSLPLLRKNLCKFFIASR